MRTRNVFLIFFAGIVIALVVGVLSSRVQHTCSIGFALLLRMNLKNVKSPGYH